MQEDSSLTNRAYVEIRRALISCRLAPGTRLSIAQLQRDVGVSQAAVREALSRLTAEGLAVIERNSGFRAAPVSVEGYRELATAVITIEVPLLRSSIENGDYAWEGALLSAYHVASRVLSEVEDGAGMEAYVANREEFHRRLFSCCDNQWLLWSWSLLYAQQLRYRHTFAELARFERGLHADYRSFLDVVIRRDVDQAERIWREYHEKVADFIESHMNPASAEANVARVA
jgi:GntR family transcriptional regulator, carbon starvation induced regulator